MRAYFSFMLIQFGLNLVVIITDSVDTVVCGQTLGEQGVAAISIATPLYMLTICTSLLFSYGSGVVYTRRSGKYDIDGAHCMAGQILLVSIAVGLLTALALFVFAPLFFSAMGVSSQVETMAAEYFVFFHGLALVYPVQAFLSYLVYQDGDLPVCAAGWITQMVVNLVASVACVESMGMVGLGFGTFLSFVASALVLSIHFLRKRNTVRFRFGSFSLANIIETLRNGMFISLQYLFQAIVMVVMNWYIVRFFGEQYLPVYEILVLLTEITLLIEAIGTGMLPTATLYYSEGNNVGLIRLSRRVLALSTGFGVFLFILMQVFAGDIPELAGITSPEVYETGITAVRICSIVYLALGLEMGLSFHYTAIDKASIPNTFESIGDSVLTLVLQLALPLVIGINGIWAGYALNPVLILAGTLIFVRLRYGKKAVPLIVEADEDHTVMAEFEFSAEASGSVANALIDQLEQRGVQRDKREKVGAFVTRLVSLTAGKNSQAGKKKVHGEVAVMLGDELVAIEKDNGILFDPSDELGGAEKPEYTVNVGFNRNRLVLS